MKKTLAALPLGVVIWGVLELRALTFEVRSARADINTARRLADKERGKMIRDLGANINGASRKSARDSREVSK